MDNFKFRVWVKPNKKNNVEGHYIDNINHIAIIPDGKVLVEYYENDETECYTILYDKDEVIVELCTGIIDTDNSLIYEGDIVHYTTGHCGSPYNITGEYESKVEYYKGRFIPVDDPEIVSINIVGNIHFDVSDDY